MWRVNARQFVAMVTGNGVIKEPSSHRYRSFRNPKRLWFSRQGDGGYRDCSLYATPCNLVVRSQHFGEVAASVFKVKRYTKHVPPKGRHMFYQATRLYMPQEGTTDLTVDLCMRMFQLETARATEWVNFVLEGPYYQLPGKFPFGIELPNCPILPKSTFHEAWIQL
jgi:hypothetical protein